MTLQFYVLRPFGDQLFGTKFAYADVLDPQLVGESEEFCPRCGRGLGSLPWLPPHRIRLSNRRYPDLLWGAGFDLMVSDRFQAQERARAAARQRLDNPAAGLNGARFAP